MCGRIGRGERRLLIPGIALRKRLGRLLGLRPFRIVKTRLRPLKGAIAVDDLVRRLREGEELCAKIGLREQSIYRQAADRIEADAKRIATIRAETIEECAKVFLQHHTVTQEQADFGNAILRAIRALGKEKSGG